MDIPIDVPSNQNIGGDVSPASPGGVDASGSGEKRFTDSTDSTIFQVFY